MNESNERIAYLCHQPNLNEQIELSEKEEGEHFVWVDHVEEVKGLPESKEQFV